MPAFSFEDLPESVQERLAAQNPEIRAYRQAQLEEGQEELREAESAYQRALLALFMARQRSIKETDSHPIFKVVGIILTVILIMNAAGVI